MSGKVFSAPNTTPYPGSTGKFFGSTWQRFLQYVGDDIVDASNTKALKDNTSFNYSIVGCICFCNYSVDTLPNDDVTVSLPYVNKYPFDFNGTTIVAGSGKITIPKTLKFIQFWFMVDWK